MKHFSLPLVIALLFFGCSSSSSKDPKTKDACVALAKADLVDFLGQGVEDGARRDVGGAGAMATVSNCMYRVNEPSYKSVSLVLRSPARGEPVQGAFDTYLKNLKRDFSPDEVIEVIPGFADGACWVPKTRQLTVFKGATMAIVSVMGAPAGEELSITRSFAEKVIGRL